MNSSFANSQEEYKYPALPYADPYYGHTEAPHIQYHPPSYSEQPYSQPWINQYPQAETSLFPFGFGFGFPFFAPFFFPPAFGPFRGPFFGGPFGRPF